MLNQKLYNALPFIWFFLGGLAVKVLGIYALFSSVIFVVVGSQVFCLRKQSGLMLIMLCFYSIAFIVARATHHI